MPTRKRDLPSTLQRSDDHAGEIYAAAKDSAEAQYGEGQRAARTAWSAVKHDYEKVGDHWESKDDAGPSDEGGRGPRGGEHPDRTRGGVDENATKQHLLEVARRLEIRGRSRMTKDELVTAIGRANDRETAKARDE